MQLGVTFTHDWLFDIDVLRNAAGEFDRSGVDFVTYGGHVLSAAVGRYDRHPATYAATFRDPFVVFSYLAAGTTRLRFRSGILILPLLPTAFVAKQCAELALVSGGRFELGVGIGSDEPEYRALGQDIAARGARLDEQLEVLRRLWVEPIVTMKSRFHDIDALGLGRLPASPIPLWVGCGETDRLLDRVARLADGWMPVQAPSTERIERLQELAVGAGRTSPIGVSLRLESKPGDLSAALDEAAMLIERGATSLYIAAPLGTATTGGVETVIETLDHLRANLLDSSPGT